MRRILAFLALVVAGCTPIAYLPDLVPPTPHRGAQPWIPLPAVVEPTPIPADFSLLTGEPCVPPCWQGLVPGESDRDDVERFLRESPMVGAWSVSPDGGAGAIYTWYWAAPPDAAGYMNIISVGDEKLRTVYLHPNAELQLGDLIEIYGEPSALYMGISSTGGPTGFIAYLYFTEIGLRLSISAPVMPEGELAMACFSPEMTISEALYFAPDDWEATLAASPLAEAERRNWAGYTCLPIGDMPPTPAG